VDRALTAVALAGMVLLIAWTLQRRRPADAPVRTGYAVPTQVARADFVRPEAPWLVVVFTSSTCTSCAGVWERAQPLASDAVAVQEVEVVAHKDLHDRYGIEAVPAALVVDAEGVVVRSFLGPVTATDLWAAVAEAREPGSTPDSCH
jgi:thioredoxin-related protein